MVIDNPKQNESVERLVLALEALTSHLQSVTDSTGAIKVNVVAQVKPK